MYARTGVCAVQVSHLQFLDKEFRVRLVRRHAARNDGVNGVIEKVLSYFEMLSKRELLSRFMKYLSRKSFTANGR
jgi:hypothetical protein